LNDIKKADSTQNKDHDKTKENNTLDECLSLSTECTSHSSYFDSPRYEDNPLSKLPNYNKNQHIKKLCLKTKEDVCKPDTTRDHSIASNYPTTRLYSPDASRYYEVDNED